MEAKQVHQPSKYSLRLQRFEVEENADNVNYIKAILFAKQNGYKFSSDCSYNGYIFFEKELCTSEDPHDGHKLIIQVYDGTNDRKYHSVDQYNMEANFGNIMDETKYGYKMVHGLMYHGLGEPCSQNIDELFSFVLKLEQKLKNEYEFYLLKK